MFARISVAFVLVASIHLPLSALAGDDAAVAGVLHASPVLQERRRIALDRLHHILTAQLPREEMLPKGALAGANAYETGARAEELISVAGATEYTWDAWFWIGITRGTSDVLFHRTRDAAGRRLREQFDALLLAGRAPHLRVESYRECLDAWAQHCGAPGTGAS